ncbi:unnamed protein product [Rotaria sp. Silwood1]|nr:unnamed protein product [Rotaria sp. Silwood1]CAF1451664.1 unnamed protein product [Rotaria sp. Silwood1]CAF3637598.1 unnamed protein product [Rotaria sp. Silwood1]CAF3637788.1 unnamed protein product [Rotaria sp. Silwood1]CAF4737480.1 unnamed protein product [Rotaria sp. Silwood1]
MVDDKNLATTTGSLTWKQKMIGRVSFIVVVLVICSATIILPPIFLHVLRQNSSFVTNLFVSACLSETCIGKETQYRTSIITALYPFDGNTNDLSGHFLGVAYGLPIPGYATATNYIRQSIDLDPTNQQYIRISHINLNQQSFTIQLWFLIRSSASLVDFGIFSQCDSDLICLSISIRNFRVTLSFDSMRSNVSTLFGGSILLRSYWYHITVVYDAVLCQQLIYINGKIDAIANGVTPYQGTSLGATTYIGLSSSIDYPLSYFHGFIDHFTISAGVARTACQIYNDATLIAYYPFDKTDTLLDRSVNLIHGISFDLTTVSSGRLQQAISFKVNTSYFQAQCFPTIRPTSVPVSVSLWVNPTMIIGGGSLVHVSTLQNGTGSICYDLLGFTAAGMLLGQLMTSPTTLINTQGVLLPLNTWTHVAVVYSSTNGFRLFINGQLTDAVSGSITTNQFSLYITLGNNSPRLSTSSSSCVSSPIVAGPYHGAIDEFRVYNRELDAQELCVLANI